MARGGEPPAGSDWRREIDDVLRGLAGGLLVGMPLIYTMETWWIGETLPMARAIAFVAVSYLFNLAFVSVTGFRGRVPGARHPVTEALEATGLAVLVAATLLVLLHQLHLDTPLDAVVGRIAVNTMPISLGVSVTHLILAPRDTRLGEGESGDGSKPATTHQLALDVGAAFTGALFLGLSIAPTEEVPMLATEIPTMMLPVLVLFSLAATYAIVFEAQFGGRERRLRTTGPFQRPVTETVLAYVVALLTCAGVLVLFGQIRAGGDWFLVYSHVVVLGMPASVGAAAGRLAV